MIEPVTLLIFSWIALRIHPHVETLSKALVIAYALMTGVSFWFFRIKFKTESDEKDPQFKYFAFLKSCIPIVTVESINTILGKIDLLLMGFFVNPSLVGIYGAAVEIGNFITKIRSSIDPTLPSLIQKIHHEKDLAKMQSWFSRSMFWIFFVTLLVTGCMTMDPDFFMSFFSFDSSFEPYFMILPMIAFGRIFHSVTGLIDAPLYMVGHAKKSMEIGIVNFVLTILSFILLIPRFGIYGAGVGYMASACLTALYRLYVANRTLHIKPINTSFLTPIFCYSCALFFTRPWHKSFHLPFKLSNILSFLVYTAAYYGCYLLVKQLKKIQKKRNLKVSQL
jgi:O-antigen/teichoic acid export membrane protein